MLDFIERSLFSPNHLFTAHPALLDAFPSCVLSSQCVRGCVLPLALDEDNDKEDHDDHDNDKDDHDHHRNGKVCCIGWLYCVCCLTVIVCFSDSWDWQIRSATQVE